MGKKNKQAAGTKSDTEKLFEFILRGAGERAERIKEWSDKLAKPSATYRLEYEDDVVEEWGVWVTDWGVFETLRLRSGHWDPGRIRQIPDKQLDAYEKARSKRHGK